MSFVHLHSHSEYSMLDGASRIREMFARAKELDMPALAITDHGVMYGAINFYLEGIKAGVKPIIGMEGYVAPRSRFDRPTNREDWYYHLTILSASLTGYRNLMKLSSLGFLEGYDPRSRRPRIDKEILAAHSDGLIVLSGCLSGEFAKSIVNGNVKQARTVAAEYREIFGDRYFLEIQDQGVQGQKQLNAEVARIGREMGIDLVATNDSHYTHQDDAEAHDILLCIQTGKELADTNRMKFDTDQFYLKSREEMLTALPDYPDSIENTLKVAEMCDIELELDGMLLPAFEVPEGHTFATYLQHLTEQGVRRRYQPVTGEITERYMRELQVIEEMGYSAYFLIVQDFVKWARDNGIRVGPGRGSVGGSIVAYALGITELDPIRWKLPFERFLNPGRRSMPDIDIDFDDRRRGDVIRYVSDKYGDDRVAQIITFSTIKAKAAIRDAARVLGYPYSVGDRLAKMYPPLILGKEAPIAACFDRNVEWPEHSGRNDAWNNASELRKAYEEDEVAHQVMDTARKLEGLSRQHSVHAAGVVIGREPLTNHVPVQKTDGDVVTQYPMGAVEKIGLLKMDFLGLRNLTVIEDTLEHLRAKGGETVDVDNLPLDDPKVFELLQQGASAGIFQMESPGMTRLLRQLRPDRFEEIADLIALYRPGPMDEIPRYVKGKHEPTAIAYFHALLEPILSDTKGVIVYQEQVTEMLQIVAGFGPEEADMVRYAIGKKKTDVLVEAKEKFNQGCMAAGLTEAEARGLWELILPFAGYSFNRAHASGYALIAYQTAYLKANYPVEYMAALLTSVKNNNDRLPFYLAECRQQGIRVLPPDVNESQLDFTPKGGEVLFGLSAVRNVGEQVSERIIQTRNSGGAFTSFEDFCRRVDSTCLNKKVVESLAKAGAFDSLGIDRSDLLELDPKGPGLCLAEPAIRLIEAIVSLRRAEEAGQFSLFSGATSSNGSSPNEPAPFQSGLVRSDVARKLVLSAEKEMLGFYVSEHPLAAVEQALRYETEAQISDLSDMPDGSVKKLGGILTNVTRKMTKKGDTWYTAILEDLRASVEIIFWPQSVQQTAPGVIEEDQIVVVNARVEVRDENVKLIAQSVKAPDLSGAITPLRIKVPATSCSPDMIEQLRGVLAAHPGPSPVLLHLDNRGRTTVLKLGGEFGVELRGGLFAELKSVLGPGALVE